MQKAGTTSVIFWWIDTILHHPFAYIGHRLSYLANLIGNHSRVIEPYVMNSPNSDVSGIETYGIDMRKTFQMWYATIRFRPFQFIATLGFSPPFVIGALLSCVVTLIWSWYKLFTNDAEIDMVLVVSSAIGMGNLIMLLMFGVADAGRYLLPSIICGEVSLLRILQYRFR
jgi:hypothetical protein